MSHRTYGLEIEMAADREDVRAAVAAATGERALSVRLARGGYREVRLSGGWVIGFDPSLHEDDLLPEECVEVSTPPFTLCEYRTKITPVLVALRPIARLTPRCGLHVHADATGLSPASLLALCRAVDGLSLSARIRPPRRRFLKPLPAGLLALPDGASEDDLRREWFAGYKGGIPMPGTGRLHPARRRVLNLGSVWFRGTVEFRWFDATLDPDQIRGVLHTVAALLGE